MRKHGARSYRRRMIVDATVFVLREVARVIGQEGMTTRKITIKGSAPSRVTIMAIMKKRMEAQILGEGNS